MHHFIFSYQTQADAEEEKKGKDQRRRLSSNVTSHQALLGHVTMR